jgi:hypothetical protein
LPGQSSITQERQIKPAGFDPGAGIQISLEEGQVVLESIEDQLAYAAAQVPVHASYQAPIQASFTQFPHPFHNVPAVTPVDSLQDSNDSPPHVGGSSEPRLSKSISQQSMTSLVEASRPPEDIKFQLQYDELAPDEEEKAPPQDNKLAPEDEKASQSENERMFLQGCNPATPPEMENTSGMPSRPRSARSLKRQAPGANSDAEDELAMDPKPKKTAKTTPLKKVLNTAGRPVRSSMRTILKKASPSPSPNSPTTPKTKPHPRAGDGLASLPKSWQHPQVLTSKQSPYAKENNYDTPKMLQSDEAWAALTVEQQLHLCSMLDNQHPEKSEDGMYRNPMPTFLSKKQREQNFVKDVANVEKDIREGRMAPKWRAEAKDAFEARMRRELLDDVQLAAKRRSDGNDPSANTSLNGASGGHDDDEEAISTELTPTNPSKYGRKTKAPRSDDLEEDEFVPKSSKRGQKPSTNPKTEQSKTSSSNKRSRSPTCDPLEKEEETVPKKTARRSPRANPGNDDD